MAINHLMKLINFEFGVGWNLLSVLVMSLAGTKGSICIGLNEFLEIDAIKESVLFLDRYVSRVDRLSLKKIMLSKDKQDIKVVLKNYFHIKYAASCDARKVEFINDGRVDYIASNSKTKPVWKSFGSDKVGWRFI